jgi:serine/threonine-protein kinase haspin
LLVCFEGREKLLYRSYDDDGYFEGQGDYQFEVYRMMRDLLCQTSDTDTSIWRQFSPKTNVYWLHYLTQKFLDYLDAPNSRIRNSEEHTSFEFMASLHRRLLQYSSVVDVIENDPFFHEIAE